MVNKKNKSKKIKTEKKDFIKLIIPLAIVIIVVVIAVILALSLTSGEQVAKVNGMPIYESQLDHHYDFMFFLSGYPEEFKSTLTKESFLSQLINEELLLQEAAKQEIQVSDEKLTFTLDTFIEGSGITKDELETIFTEKGFELSDLSDYYERQLIMLMFVNETVFNYIEVSDEEAESYYDENSDQFTAEKGQIKIRHILVETEEEAEDLLVQLEDGSDFAELSAEYSLCPSSAKGGDLGFIERGQMVKEFEDAAFDLEVGDLSDIVETQFGYHILLRDPNEIYFSDAKDSIVLGILEQRRQARLEEYLVELRENAEVEIYLDIIETPEIVIEEDTEEIKNSTEEIAGETLKEETETCYTDYDISSDTVIFYHTEWCPHCNNMMPIIEELEDEGYHFLWVEANSGENTAVIDDCFTDVIQGGVPEFICAATKEFDLGEMSKKELKDFADNCKV